MVMEFGGEPCAQKPGLSETRTLAGTGSGRGALGLQRVADPALGLARCAAPGMHWEPVAPAQTARVGSGPRAGSPVQDTRGAERPGVEGAARGVGAAGSAPPLPPSLLDDLRGDRERTTTSSRKASVLPGVLLPSLNTGLDSQQPVPRGGGSSVQGPQSIGSAPCRRVQRLHFHM